VALVADGVGSVHGVARTVQEIADRGVPGFEVEVIGTDAAVDHRLSAVCEVALPFVPDVTVGVPSLPAVVEALTERRYDLVHLCTPGPAGIVSALTGRLLGLATCGSYHTELGAYAALRSGDPHVAAVIDGLVAAFYGHCPVVLSPSAASDRRLVELGVEPARIHRWDRGVDVARFSPARRVDGRFGGDHRVNVLYAGRLTREKGVGLLADAFSAAHERDRRLHLVVAGGGPEEAMLRDRLGERVSFLGWLHGDELAVAYASADLFLFCSQTDTFGQVLLEAQASGLPVVAVAAGGPAELVTDGRTGLLCPPDAEVLGSAVAGLAASRPAHDRLARAAVDAVADRTWERALERLAAGWRQALAAPTAVGDRASG
jgi:glycosyltransferase involved in cell wall biosynthesis